MMMNTIRARVTNTIEEGTCIDPNITIADRDVEDQTTCLEPRNWAKLASQFNECPGLAPCSDDFRIPFEAVFLLSRLVAILGLGLSVLVTLYNNPYRQTVLRVMRLEHESRIETEKHCVG
jgi:hypothetical protein